MFQWYLTNIQVPTLDNLVNWLSQPQKRNKLCLSISCLSISFFCVSAEAGQGRERRGPRGKEKKEGKMPTKSLTHSLALPCPPWRESVSCNNGLQASCKKHPATLGPFPGHWIRNWLTRRIRSSFISRTNSGHGLFSMVQSGRWRYCAYHLVTHSW